MKHRKLMCTGLALLIATGSILPDITITEIQATPKESPKPSASVSPSPAPSASSEPEEDSEKPDANKATVDIAKYNYIYKDDTKKYEFSFTEDLPNSSSITIHDMAAFAEHFKSFYDTMTDSTGHLDKDQKSKYTDDEWSFLEHTYNFIANCIRKVGQADRDNNNSQLPNDRDVATNEDGSVKTDADGNILHTEEGREPYTDGFEDKYKDILSSAFTESLFIEPFIGNLKNAYSIDVIKQNLPELKRTNDAGNEVTYEPRYFNMYFDDKEGNQTVAKLRDILTPDATQGLHDFYVLYSEKVEIEEENEEGEIEKEIYWKYLPETVYYPNTLSQAYMTMSASKEGNFSKFTSYLDSTLELDQYGNITVNTGGDHVLVLPTMENPAFTQDNYFMPTPLLWKSTNETFNKYLSDKASQFPTADSHFRDLHSHPIRNSNMKSYFKDESVEGYGAGKDVKNFVDSDENKNAVLVTPVFESILGQLQNNTLSPSSALINESYQEFGTSYGSDLYKCIANAKNEKYDDKSTPKPGVLLILGPGYKNNVTFNTFNPYSALYTGLSSKFYGVFTNDRGSAVPIYGEDSQFYWGISGAEEFKLSKFAINGYAPGNNGVCSPRGTPMGNTDTPYQEFYDMRIASGSGNRNHGITHTMEDTNVQEVKTAFGLVEDFLGTTGCKSTVEDKLGRIIEHGLQGVTAVDSTQQDTLDSQADTQAQQDSDVSDIIKRMRYWVMQPGTSERNIKTSEKHRQYIDTKIENITSLFQISNTLKDETVNNFIIKFFTWIIIIAVIKIFFTSLSLMFDNHTTVKDYIVRAVLCCALGVMPLVAMIYTCGLTDALAGNIFKNTFHYWTMLDFDYNISNTTEDYSAQQIYNEYFREFSSLNGHKESTIEIYSSSGSTDKKLPEFLENINNVIMNNDRSLIEGKTSTSSVLDCLGSQNLTKGGADFANQDKYNQGIFVYFHDRFTHEFKEYCSIKGIDLGGEDADTNGLLSHADPMKMFTDPEYLYGSTYTGEDAEAKDLRVQDILGLSYLFSDREIDGEDVYFSKIKDSDWYQSLLTNDVTAVNDIYGNFENVFDPSNYPSQQIKGNLLEDDETPTVFESALQKVNTKFAKDIQKFGTQTNYLDETVITTAALIATFDFNEEMNHAFNPKVKLVPTRYEVDTFSMDTLFRCLYMPNSNDRLSYSDNLMCAAEQQGGFFSQGLILCTSYISMVCSNLINFCLIAIFLIACFVFFFTYILKSDATNKAWAGLAFAIVSTIGLHSAFCVIVSWSCSPSKNILTIMPAFVKLLWVALALIIRTFLMLKLLIFLGKHYKDLGGEIIVDKTTAIFDQVKGKINSIGDMFSRAGIGKHRMKNADMNISRANSKMKTSKVDMIALNSESITDDSKAKMLALAETSGLKLGKPAKDKKLSNGLTMRRNSRKVLSSRPATEEEMLNYMSKPNIKDRLNGASTVENNVVDLNKPVTQQPLSWDPSNNFVGSNLSIELGEAEINVANGNLTSKEETIIDLVQQEASATQESVINSENKITVETPTSSQASDDAIDVEFTEVEDAIEQLQSFVNKDNGGEN